MKQSELFSSRWALILAAIGMAVGTGNIWRFPRMAAQNGGGAFLIPWIIFLFLWSIPLLMVEMGLGKHTRLGTIGAFGKFLGKRFTWMGAFVGFCTMAIMFYYSVVMGWCLKYFVSSLFFEIGLNEPGQFWSTFTGGFQPVFFHLLSMALGSFVIYKGVVGGIERANKFIIPILFVLLVIGAVRALTLPGAIHGLNFMFKPDLNYLFNYQTWLEALSQSAWSTGAGWGLILTYAVYMRKREDIVLNSFIAGLGNNTASLLAGIAIIPTVFTILPSEQAREAMAAGNTGMTFIWVPQLFKQMPLGSFFQILFFLALLFAALSSLIAMIELAARIFMDAGLERPKAILYVGSFGFLLGLPSALSLSFFDNQDWVWGMGLIVSGMFFTFAVLKYGAGRFRQVLINVEGNDVQAGRWFDVIINYLIPLEVVALIGWWFWQAYSSDPAGSFTLFSSFNIGTCLIQWGIVIALLLVVNNWLFKRTIVEPEAMN